MNINEARAYFPRGLFQPEGSFRFSIDALLLGAFAARLRRDARRVLDLGCGCGVAGFAVALALPASTERTVQLYGLDKEAQLLDAAKINAKQLGLEYYTTVNVDLCDPLAVECLRSSIAPLNFDLAIFNPPYRLIGSGRLPASALRCSALFGNERTVPAFAATAALAIGGEGGEDAVLPTGAVSAGGARHKQACANTGASAKSGTGNGIDNDTYDNTCVRPAIVHKGHVGQVGLACAILPYSRLAVLEGAFARSGLKIQELCYVLPKSGSEPELVLCAAGVQEPVSGKTEMNLVLYEQAGFFTAQALRFCSFLSCNNRGRL